MMLHVCSRQQRRMRSRLLQKDPDPNPNPNPGGGGFSLSSSLLRRHTSPGALRPQRTATHAHAACPAHPPFAPTWSGGSKG